MHAHPLNSPPTDTPFPHPPLFRSLTSIPPAAASPADSGRARSDGLGHYSGRLRTGGSKDNALETQTPGTLAAATPGAAVDVASRASSVDTSAASRVRLQA